MSQNGIKLYKLASCVISEYCMLRVSLLFEAVINSYSFEIKNFCFIYYSLFTFYITLCNLHNYAWIQYGRITKSTVEHTVTCTNYILYRRLIVLIVRCLLTIMST